MSAESSSTRPPAGSGAGAERSRAVASIVLAVLGAVLLLAGALLLYARTEIIDQEAFADHATAALENEDVSRVVSREIVVNLIDRGSTDLVAARPVLESVVDATVRTGAFRQLFRAAAVQANRVLFVRDKDNVAFDLADASEVVRFGLQSVSPKLADALPKNIDVALLTLKRREFAKQTLAVADTIRWLGLVLPLLAILAFVGAIAVAPDRRIGVLRSAIGVGAAGLLLAIVLIVLRQRVLAGVVGEDELSDADVRAAVSGILDAFLGDLFGWALFLAFGGLVVGAAAAVLSPEHVEQPGARLRRRLVERPATTRGRALRGAAAILVGIWVALDPTLALQLAAVLAGAYLVFFGTCEVLVLLQPPGISEEESGRRRRRGLVTAGAAGAAVVIALVVVVLVVTDSGRPGNGAGQPAEGCNGSKDLCSLRLNEAVFAGTHNSFSAADSPNWLIANQRRTIERQLHDGIHLFLIDPHWGVSDGKGHVRTDFKAEGRDRNRVAKSLPPATLAAAQRLVGQIGLGNQSGGKREVWLCHSVCELGATKMLDAINTVGDFLDEHPGQVVILFIEPYVPPSAIADVFRQAGVDHYLATLDRGAPLPTLGDLVRTNKRLVVFTEQDADGDPPWYLDGFSFIQDTPLGIEKAADASCDLNRGSAASPLLMINNWADVFPPRLRANEDFQREQFILRRAHRCARQRGLPVNMIADDFYDQGDLVEAVAKLNAEAIARHERALAR